MDLNEIEQHWKNWAEQFKTDLRATTKTRTIKELEISALYRAFKKTPFFSRNDCHILEVGCGNGHNCFKLFDLFPNFTFTGVDLIPEMISSANEIKNSNLQYEKMNFFVGNVLALNDCIGLEDQYQIVFTDRCLINLNTHELQINALDQLYRKTEEGGYIVLIENVYETYCKQNHLRKSVGLKKRMPDKFNLFINESRFLSHAEKKLSLVDVEDFASLHDIVLYVLVPMLNNGDIDYNSPMVLATTKLLLSIPEGFCNMFGNFGQNRLYLFKKEFDSEK
jgi:SAM-dependent methyltransferase